MVAGILKREFSEVQSVYEAAGWRLVASKGGKEWRSGTFVRAALKINARVASPALPSMIPSDRKHRAAMAYSPGKQR